MLNEKELKLLVAPILKRRLSRAGLEAFTIQSGEDHDGDPALFIVARFRPTAAEFDGASLLDSIREIREELRRRGDPRLPYVRYQTADQPHEVIG